MLTFITKLSFNLIVLKNPRVSPDIFLQAQLREYKARSPAHIKTHGLL
jgi:hypothetical protein